MVDVTDDRIDPAAVIAAIMRDVVDSGCSRSRHLIRMMPLQATCFASLEDLELTAKPLIEKRFGSAADSDESAERKVCVGLAYPLRPPLSLSSSNDQFGRRSSAPAITAGVRGRDQATEQRVVPQRRSDRFARPPRRQAPPCQPEASRHRHYR